MDLRVGRLRLGLLDVERRRTEQLRFRALRRDGRAVGRLERLAMRCGDARLCVRRALCRGADTVPRFLW